jgi:hypothetical protein
LRYGLSFEEHLQKLVGKKARLEKVQTSVRHGADYAYLIEFTPGHPRGERVILKEVWTDCVLIEYVETKEQREILIERIHLGALK